MKVVDITFDYVMQIPLSILPLLAADFDGDVLNILLIINEDFRREAERILDPRNAMYISKNDGKLDASLIPNRDTMININSLIFMCRENYTEEQVREIEELKTV